MTKVQSGAWLELEERQRIELAIAGEWQSYRKAAEQGDAQSQSYLGLCYANGKGVGKDMTEAVKWFRLAAKQGFVKAQYNMGVCYAFGRGVAKDMAEAEKWYRKAAEQGNENAKISLAGLEEQQRAEQANAEERQRIEQQKTEQEARKRAVAGGQGANRHL